MATGVEQRSFVHYSSQCALITPDDRWVLSGANDGTISVWNLETGDLRTRITDQAGVVGLAMAPSGPVLAACEFTSGNRRSIFDLNLAGPTAAQRALIKALMSKLDDDSYEVRETASNEFLKLGFVAEPELHRAMNEAASVEVRIRIANLPRHALQVESRVPGHTEQVECLAFAPDGKLLASGSEDGTVRLWEIGTGKEAKCFVPK